MKLPFPAYNFLRSQFLWCFTSAIVIGISTTEAHGQIVQDQRDRGNLNDSLFSEPSSILGAPTLLSWQSASERTSSEPIGPITTDRPDFTEASSTVGANVAQVEMGYTFTHDNDERIATGTHSTPETLFRIGTPINWLELRLAANLLQEDIGSVSNSGAEDLYLGTKPGLTAQDGNVARNGSRAANDRPHRRKCFYKRSGAARCKLAVRLGCHGLPVDGGEYAVQ